MDLANMREQGVRGLIAYCLNGSCRHQATIDVSTYKRGARRNKIDVVPNWKEVDPVTDWRGRPAIADG
jgi:hypothetical protein